MPDSFHEDVRGDGYVSPHSARCLHCLRGVERQAQSLSGSVCSYGHGPYETCGQAFAEAERMGLPVAHRGECLPPGAPA